MPSLNFSDFAVCKRFREASPGTLKFGSRRLISTGELPDAGSRYRSILPASDLSCFPDPVQRLIVDSQSGFVRRDQGQTRQNDSTFASRAMFFRTWLHRHGLLDPGILSSLSAGQAIALLGAYIDDIAGGRNLSKRSDVSDDTIQQ